MALAAVAFGAAAVSGAALGASCTSELLALSKVAVRPPLDHQPVGPKETEGEPPSQVYLTPSSSPPPSAVPGSPTVGAARPRRSAAAIDKDIESMVAHRGVMKGFSMEEARAHADEGQSRAMARTPMQVLQDMQRGNVRFWTRSASRPEANAFERRALISKQFPSVAILGCSDSRVPVELVFDAGLGDIFVIRVAGNALGTSTQASLQYAVNHLKVKVVIVLGHEKCGAVMAAQLPTSKLENEPEELAFALKNIKIGLRQDRLSYLKDSRALDREAVTTNVKNQVERLARDEGMKAKVLQKDLMIVGAFYEISSGIVDFFHEVSGESGSTIAKCPTSPQSRDVKA